MVFCAKNAAWATLHTVLLSIIIPLTLVPPSFIFLYVPISALLPDFHHVDLIPENFIDATTHTPPHHQTKLRIFQVVQCSHQFQLPCGKIELGAFIEMGDLIPNCLRLDDNAHSKLRCPVTNISEWLWAFAVYISVIAKKQPHRIPDLMGYQILILEASN